MIISTLETSENYSVTLFNSDSFKEVGTFETDNSHLIDNIQSSNNGDDMIDFIDREDLEAYCMSKLN